MKNSRRLVVRDGQRRSVKSQMALDYMDAAGLQLKTAMSKRG